MIDINIGDVVLDTFYYAENLKIDPLFIVRYVLYMDYEENGKQYVLLSPPTYKYHGKQPRFDFVLADVQANCHVEKPRHGRFSWRDIKDTDGKKVGILYVDEPAKGSKEYEVMFKDFSSDVDENAYIEPVE